MSLTSSSSADSPVQIISSGGYDEEEDGGDEDVSILGEQILKVRQNNKNLKQSTWL